MKFVAATALALLGSVSAKGEDIFDKEREIKCFYTDPNPETDFATLKWGP